LSQPRAFISTAETTNGCTKTPASRSRQSTFISEIDNLFGYGRFVKPGKLILLMHDEMFQDAFNGKANLTALIDGLRKRGYSFGSIARYDG
jgi:hypothetical protein